jgi:ABC-type protease/lipase transport system fused ATPase/permease subunit
MKQWEKNLVTRATQSSSKNSSNQLNNVKDNEMNKNIKMLNFLGCMKREKEKWSQQTNKRLKEMFTTSSKNLTLVLLSILFSMLTLIGFFSRLFWVQDMMMI